MGKVIVWVLFWYLPCGRGCGAPGTSWWPFGGQNVGSRIGFYIFGVQYGVLDALWKSIFLTFLSFLGAARGVPEGPRGRQNAVCACAELPLAHPKTRP